jgi:hypothetical protein
LRLVFPARDADELSALSHATGDLGDLTRIAARAHSTSVRVRWRARLRRTDTVSRPPLAPGLGVTSEQALALALHLGLHLSQDELADVLQRDEADIAHYLTAARASLLPDAPPVCRAMPHAVPLYRDDHLEPGERIALLTHLSGCERCQSTLQAFQTLDDALLAEIDATVAALPPLSLRQHGYALESWTPFVGVAAALVALVVLSMVVGALAGGEGEPVPLLAGSSNDDLSGWLLLTTPEGQLWALDLATGERRELGAGSRRPVGQRFVSPAGTRIASWYWPAAGPEVNVVQITTLVGDLVSVLAWPEPGTRKYPAGWLTDEALLVVTVPERIPGEAEAHYRARAEDAGQLRAVDVGTGAEQVLASGYVVSATLSPDSTRLLTLHAPADRSRGLTLAVRDVTAGALGTPQVLLEGRFSVDSGLAWAADGRTLLAARNLADRSWAPPGDRPGPWESDTVPRELLAFGPDGHRTALAHVAQGATLRVIGATSTGMAYYVVGDWALDRIHYNLWSVPLDASAAATKVAELPGEPAGWATGALRSPDGTRLLLQTTQPLYLSVDQRERGLGDVLTTAYLSIGAQGELRMHEVSLSIGGAAVAWLPGSALPVREVAQPASIAALQTAPVQAVRLWHVLGTDGVTSADGRYVVLTDTEADLPIVWEVERRSGRRLLGGARDLAWIDQESALLAVTGATTVSRLALFDTRLFTPDRMYDYRRFDPAALGTSTSRTYARPLLSPDGAHLAFFVRDSVAQRVELWLAGWDAPARVARSWEVPLGRKVVLPLVAFWADSATLVFVEPSGWERGYPTLAVVQRLSVHSGSGATVVPVTTLRGRGSDLGIVVTAMALSPDGAMLAWRTAHYPVRGPRGMYEVVQLAPARDISQEIELGRGPSGQGLAWEPERAWLAFTLGSSVYLASADARMVEVVSDVARPDLPPVWLAGDLWCARDGPPGSRIMRVALSWR